MPNAEVDSAHGGAYCQAQEIVNYNPYAPPDASRVASAAATVDGQPQPWTSTEAISLAWERFKDGWPVLLGSYLLVTLVVGVVQQAAAVLLALHVVAPASLPYYLALFASFVVGQTIGAFLNVGLVRIWLDAARGNELSFGVLFSGADCFLPVLGLDLLMILAIGGGFLLFIVPGIILALGLFAAPFYVVDASLGPIEAMKASWVVCQGQKANLFGLGLAGAGLGLLGLAVCCVGVFAAVPLYAVASAVVFVRLTGRGVALPAPADEPAPWAAPPAE